MRKGDERRRAILDMAEQLFYTNGYEATSVQDIIDALHYSKGGFYHHFTSKLSLLEAICEERAQASYDNALEAVKEHPGDAVAQLNAFFLKGSILQSQSQGFLSLLIQVAYREDGVLMREKLKQHQIKLTLPLMQQIVEAGIDQKKFFVPFPSEMGELVLRLSIQLTDEVSFQLATNPDAPDLPTAILEKVQLYRYAVERLLNAPYGSVIILEYKQITGLVQQLLDARRQSPQT